jgi:hypothetical protein
MSRQRIEAMGKRAAQQIRQKLYEKGITTRDQLFADNSQASPAVAQRKQETEDEAVMDMLDAREPDVLGSQSLMTQQDKAIQELSEIRSRLNASKNYSEETEEEDRIVKENGVIERTWDGPTTQNPPMGLWVESVKWEDDRWRVVLRKQGSPRFKQKYGITFSNALTNPDYAAAQALVTEAGFSASQKKGAPPMMAFLASLAEISDVHRLQFRAAGNTMADMVPSGFLQPQNQRPQLDQGTIDLEIISSQTPIQPVTQAQAEQETGRAQPDSEYVLTPAGPRRIGSLEVGDTILTPDGHHKQQVEGIYPQGEMDIVEVETESGRTTRASLDHLWLAVDDQGKVYAATQTEHLQPGWKLPVLA